MSLYWHNNLLQTQNILSSFYYAVEVCKLFSLSDLLARNSKLHVARAI